MAASQNHVRTGVNRGVEKLLHRISAEISATYLATIVNYNKKKHVADILPLANSSDGETSAQYLDIPVAKTVYLIDEWIEKFSSEFTKLDANTKHVNTEFMKKLKEIRPKPYLRKGTVVVVAVLDRDSQAWDGSGTTYTPTTGRLHDPNDSIIIALV